MAGMMTETKRYVNKKHLLTYTLDDQVVHAMHANGTLVFTDATG